MEERCRACRMLGGREKPCVSKLELRLFPKEHGRPCPRVDLAPGNAALAELLPFVVREDLRQLAGRAFDAMTADWERDERLDFLTQVSRTIGSAEVSDELYLSDTERKKREGVGREA